jgi:hypothetical protein
MEPVMHVSPLIRHFTLTSKKQTAKYIMYSPKNKSQKKKLIRKLGQNVENMFYVNMGSKLNEKIKVNTIVPYEKGLNCNPDTLILSMHSLSRFQGSIFKCQLCQSRDETSLFNIQLIPDLFY